MQFCQKITKVIQKHWKWFKFCHSWIHNWNSVFLIKFSTSSYLWQIITNIPTWPKRLDTKHSYFKIKIYACHTSMFVMKEVLIASTASPIYSSSIYTIFANQQTLILCTINSFNFQSSIFSMPHYVIMFKNFQKT